MRLTANWNRSAAILLMNGGGGGGESSEDIKIDKEEELMDKSPAHKIAKEMFLQLGIESKSEENTSDSKITTKGNEKENIKVSPMKYDKGKLAILETRIQKLNPKNKEELDLKIREDIKVLLNLTKGTDNSNNIIPKVFSLSQNYPNPFNPSTTIKFALPNDVKVVIKIYDILGREVKTLVNDFKKAGYYQETFDGTNLASGVYFYHIEAGNFIQSKKMVLVK